MQPNSSRRKTEFQLDPEAVERIEREFDDGDLSDYSNYDMPDEPQKPKKKHRRLKKLILWLVILCMVVLGVNAVIMLATGNLQFNDPKKRDYPVRGPVVDESLGNIGWESFAQQNIQMAYIRATKSTSYVDENFDDNKKGADSTDLPVGMLHIFDIGMDGKEQADHFADTVGEMTGYLLPAVEIKFTGFYRIIPADSDKIAQRLLDFVDEIYSIYGVKPIIKCNGKSYRKIVSREEFSDCPKWYESVYSKPDEDIEYTFWGYSNRIKYSYYQSGDYLQMVLFNGSEEEFKKMYV